MTPVRLERDGRVAVVEFADLTMNRRFVSWLSSILDWLDAADAVQAVVFTGARRVFMSGADLAEVRRLHTAAEVEEFLRIPHQLMRRIATQPRFTIAAINGYCLGGGLELAAICDYRLAPSDLHAADGSELALFGFPEIRLGLVPALGGMFSISRVAPQAAFRLLSTGLPVTASEALRTGIVHELAPHSELLERSLAVTDSFSAHNPDALRSLKRLMIAANRQADFDEALRHARLEFACCCSNPGKDERLDFASRQRAAAFRRGPFGNGQTTTGSEVRSI